MIALLVIAASVAATAVAGLWLYAHPAARARLLATLPPVESFRAASPWAAGVIAVFVLVAGHLVEAAAWAVTAGVLGVYDHTVRAVDQRAADAERREHAVRDELRAAQLMRDAYADALGHVLRLTDLHAVKAVATTALESGTYPGDLTTTRAVVAEQAAEIAALEAALSRADRQDWTQTGPIDMRAGI